MPKPITPPLPPHWADDRRCMFCGQPVLDRGEGYYDHIRSSQGCETAWKAWRDMLVADHPGGD